MSRRPGGTGAQMPPPRIRAATGDSAGPPSARSGRAPLAAADDDEAIFLRSTQASRAGVSE